jgi:type II secretory ATPase GspE/PulE/Tfp pilus assembly ATPase PilB-like protein/DNA-binding response OmpR family regulator
VSSSYANLFTGVPAETAAPIAQPSVYNILLVDDEENVLKALRRVFRQENYRIHIAANGHAALEVLAREPCQLMISDYMMPGMNGAELLRKAKAQFPEMIRIMLTGHADTNAVMAAVKEGAVYKFILKPWNDDDLRVTVALALEQFELQRKNRALQKENAARANEVKKLAKLAVNNRSQLAILLHKRGLLNDQQVQEIYQRQQARKEPVIKLILARDWVSEKQLRGILRSDLMLDEVGLAELHVDPAVAALLPRHFCETQWVLPIKQQGRRLTLAMADPMDTGLIDDLRFSLDMEVQPVMADVAHIQDKIKQVYGDEVSFDDLETLVAGADPFEGIEVVIDEDDDLSLTDLLRDTEEPPAIRLVNAIILEAVRLGASDIHIHPRAKSVSVRYRIDGILQDKIQVPHALHMSLVARIKVMSELDITERRRPQDGRITVKTPMRIIDLRISTLPTINGEKVVMRILDRNAAVQRLDELGLSPRNLAKIANVVSKPQGIILATGPTGSGKTTTLYSMLQHQATAEKNYVTIEDPVEYYLDMAGQVMIKERIGLDFATVLRAILRQDPDVILLGEIRDTETAEVAFHAALTGHLVYSTLHTNSAMASIGRLLDLGLKPYVIATALEALVAQRLVRRICGHCREDVTPPAELVRKLGPVFQRHTQYFRGKGCPQCHGSGYRGRVALYEVFTPSDTMRHLISSGASMMEVDQQAEAEGMEHLIEDAREKIAAGLTTADEVLRVLGPQVMV